MKKETKSVSMSVAAIIAWGICIMLICIGVGGCMMLGQSKIDLKFDNTRNVQPATCHPR